MEKILSSEMADERINELTEKRNAIAEEIAEKRTEFEAGDVETRDAILEDVESKQTEVEEIDKEIEETRSIKETYEKQEERMSLMKNVETIEVEKRMNVADEYDTPEYRKAYMDAIISGNDRELRALTTGTTPVVPTIMQGYVEAAWEKLGLANLVNKSFVKGAFAIPVEMAAGDAVLHTEGGAAVADEELTIDQVLLYPQMVKKVIAWTDELEALAPEEFFRYLADELVYKLYKKLETEIVKGAGDGNGHGVIGITNGLGTAASLVEKVEANLTFNAINEALATLADHDNLTILMNPTTFFKNVMGLTDLQQRPIYQVATDNAGKPRYMINGINVVFTSALNAYDSLDSDSDPWAIVGDLKAYRLNMPEGNGVKTIVDPYTRAPQDQKLMVGRILAAGNVVRPKAIAALVQGA